MPVYKVTAPDGTPYNVTAPEGASMEDIKGRVRQQHMQTRDNPLATADSAVRGFADMATFGLADKISAAGNAILPLDKLGGRNVSSVWQGKSFPQAFRENIAGEEMVSAADETVNPYARIAGQVGGAIAGPVPGRGLIAKGASGLGKAAPLARVVGESAVQSGLYGAGKGSSTDPQERINRAWQDALAGAAGAALGYGLVKGGARVISPNVSKEVRQLAQSGVTMTPGQRGGRVARTLESAAESIPGVGQIITGAKRRGVEQFNKAWANEALSPIGARVPKSLGAGYDSIEYAQKAVSKAYDDALSGISAPADDVFQMSMADTASKINQLPQAQAEAVRSIMNLRINPFIQGKQVMDGKTLQNVYRTLQRDISGLRKSGDPIADLSADVLQEVRDNFMSLANRHAGANTRAFQKANEASARLSRVEDAASRAQSVGGVFTPSTAASAAARKGFGTTTKNLARGQARMQSLADAAKAVLPNSLPDSGTATRGALMAGVGAAASGGAGLGLSPWMAGVGPLLAPYIPKVGTAMQNFALRGQGPLTRNLANEVGQRAYIGGMVGSPLLVQKGR